MHVLTCLGSVGKDIWMGLFEETSWMVALLSKLTLTTLLSGGKKIPSSPPPPALPAEEPPPDEEVGLMGSNNLSCLKVMT